MRDSIRNLAKAAVTGLIKSDPSVLAIEGGKLAIDRLFGWLPQKGKLDVLIGRVEGELERLAEAEFKGRADLEPAIVNATILFEKFGLTATDLVDLSFKPDRATEELLKRGKDVLRAAGEAVAGLCGGRVVPRIYELLLDDPQTIADLSPAVTRALLSQREAIEKIPDEVGLALHRMLGRHLVTDPTKVWHPELSDVFMLRAEYGVVPFHEQRRPDVERLLAWCERDAELAVRVMTGAGGTGKTRLMIELCKQARLRGWRAGFLDREVPAAPSWELDGLVDSEKPLLLVVDYAETKRDVLVQVLRRLSLDRHSSMARVILVARALSDWWLALRRADPELQELLDEEPAPLEELSPIALPVDQRALILQAATAAFADHLVVTYTHRGRPSSLDLSAPHFANALFLHIAALAAVVGDPAKEEDALLRFVLRREERHWQNGLISANLSQDLDVSSVAQALALATVAGGAENKAEARVLLARAPDLSELSPPKLNHLIDLLHRLCPGESYFEPLRPDLLGEELVDRALSDDPALLTAALGEGASLNQVQNALTVLTRLAQRRPDAQRWLEQALVNDLERLAEPAIQVAIETGPPMGKMLAQSLQTQSVHDPARLEALIPRTTTELLAAAVLVTSQVWARFLGIPKPWDDEVKMEAAPVANDLANRLSAAGQHKEALKLGLEAVGLYRDLAQGSPDVYQPGLATALDNVSNRLSMLNRHEEALAAAREGVGIRRALVAKRRDPHDPDLARALNNLSGCLSAVHWYEYAVKAAKEATDLYRELAEEDPAAFLPYFAGALGNLASRLSESDQRQQALGPARECASIYGYLADKMPDAYRPDLARALYNLAISLSELGESREAVAPAREAVTIQRALAKRAPDAFGHNLAKFLNTLAICLADVGQRSEALRSSTEAAQTLASHFLGLPEAHASSMEGILQTYSVLCSELGVEPDMELLAPIIELRQKTPRSPESGKESEHRQDG